jgi:hypothetical protein
VGGNTHSGQGTTERDEIFRTAPLWLAHRFAERAALIIIDLAKAFTDQKAMLGANLDKAIVATKRLFEAAHTRRMPSHRLSTHQIRSQL